jgi:hypothetical protein
MKRPEAQEAADVLVDVIQTENSQSTGPQAKM